MRHQAITIYLLERGMLLKLGKLGKLKVRELVKATKIHKAPPHSY